MKKWFFTSPSYLICMLPFIPIAVLIFTFTILMIVAGQIYGIIVCVIGSFFCILFFRLIVYQSFTWVVLDAKGVRLYGVFGKIKELLWRETAFVGIGLGRGKMPEVVYYFVGTSEKEQTIYKRGNYTEVEIDGATIPLLYMAGREKHQYTCNTKKGLITLRMNKKTTAAIEQFYHQEIKDADNYKLYITH